MTALSPGLILAILIVLIGAQAARVIAPNRAPYMWTIVLAVIGFLAGEIAALSPHLSGPAVGVIHPLPDVIVIAALEAAGSLVTARPQRS